MKQVWFEVKAVILAILILILIVMAIDYIKNSRLEGFLVIFYLIFILAGFINMILDRQKELGFKSESSKKE